MSDRTAATQVDQPEAATDLCASTEPCVATFRQMVHTYLKLQRQLEEVLDPFGLVLSQFEALIKIQANPGLIQQELVAHLLVTKGNVGALLDRLASMGLVERRPDPLDRRANRLYMTRDGCDIIGRIRAEHHGFLRDHFRVLDDAQCGQLRSLLKAIEPG